ncbi:hypothetical protein F511_17183 [Dorcoceras hygrometricum]|uniref:Uncharacterized protein n=1 Tax=Dorcoceras hygrometricum TaxID=472368 RepID=A0A2Z7D0C9_9LAMI|nr:hypothetical protein F511_17183 [Dorcoceras hygrometricum]
MSFSGDFPSIPATVFHVRDFVQAVTCYVPLRNLIGFCAGRDLLRSFEESDWLRQSGPRPDSRLLRQTALEVLTRSARSDSPRRTGRNKLPAAIGGGRRRRTAGGGGGAWREEVGGYALGLGIGYN